MLYRYLHTYMKENNLHPPSSRILGIDPRVRLLDDENIYLTFEFYCAEKFLSLLNCYAQFLQLQGYKIFIEKVNRKPNDHVSYGLLKSIGVIEDGYVNCYLMTVCAYPFTVMNDDGEKSTTKIVLINHYLYMYQNLTYLARCYRYYHENDNWPKQNMTTEQKNYVRRSSSECRASYDCGTSGCRATHDRRASSGTSEEASSSESSPLTYYPSSTVCHPVAVRPAVRPVAGSYVARPPFAHVSYSASSTYVSLRPVRPVRPHA